MGARFVEDLAMCFIYQIFVEPPPPNSPPFRSTPRQLSLPFHSPTAPHAVSPVRRQLFHGLGGSSAEGRDPSIWPPSGQPHPSVSQLCIAGTYTHPGREVGTQSTKLQTKLVLYPF